ncbi:CbiQ family ECF transporter T component [Azoarcus sp. DN11]|uniref:CbiQ family ECF transporter T component n=1 Tax=Azoarcus sp. DN11 TaxID=356837 RepID=UPI002570DE52|nr:CbiQ family ECF transporter T component [Azoarcus sp. DN11]
MFIALWMAFVVVLQFLSPKALMFAVFACAFAAWRLSPSRSMRLLRRVRFLILAILVLFAGFTPGEALLPAFPEISPSREGVMMAAEHVGRLVGVVLCVAMLMDALPVRRLVGGLHALLRPFGWVGLPSERLAVRLVLVLRYVESAAPGDWRNWLEDDHAGGSSAEVIAFTRETFAWSDLVAMFVVVVAAAIWWGVAR